MRARGEGPRERSEAGIARGESAQRPTRGVEVARAVQEGRGASSERNGPS
jgi:hypothetical protein